MANREQLKDWAVTRFTLDEQAIDEWHEAVLGDKGKASDAVVPYALGPLDVVEEYCDREHMPLYIIDKDSRRVSVAHTYIELEEYENSKE